MFQARCLTSVLVVVIMDFILVNETTVDVLLAEEILELLVHHHEEVIGFSLLPDRVRTGQLDEAASHAILALAFWGQDLIDGLCPGCQPAQGLHVVLGVQGVV